MQVEQGSLFLHSNVKVLRITLSSSIFGVCCSQDFAFAL